MPAAAFKTALGNNFNNTSGTTLAITTTAAIAIGDLVVVRWASDNLSATTPTATCADGGNTYTVQRQAAANATAAAGIAGGLLTSVATVARASGSTITLTFSGAITGKAAYAESFTNATATTRVAIVGTTAASGTASSTGASAAGLVAGDLCLGFSAVQSRVAVTGDADTTNGSWSTIVHINGGGTTGQDATSVQINGQYKVVTATGAQTYDNTVTSTYWVNGLVILQQAPNPAITQAAYQFFDDAGTETGAASLAAINTSIIGNTVNGDGLGVLRIRLQLTTAVATQATDDWQLQWEKNGNGTWTNVTTGGTTVKGYDNPNLTGGAATTNRMGAGTGSFVAGVISETGDVPNFGWSASNFTELVYSLRLPQADFANNDVLRFRVLYNGATTLMTYTQTPLITVRTPVALAGESDGVSTASGALTVTAAYVTGTRVLESAAGRFTEDAVARLLESAVVAGPVALAGQSDGTSTASGTLTVTRSLAAQADGVATVTSALVVAKALAGQSSGVGTTSASMVEAKALAGESDGVSTATASLVAARPLAGQSDGVSTVTSDLTVAKAPKLLAGQSDGVSTVTGSLSITKALAGESDGVATSTAAMVVAKALAGQSAGVATTTALLGVTRSLAGESDGVSTTTAALARARPLAGQSDGVATVGSSSTAVIIANDPCDNFTTNSWTNASCSISASGHTGNAFSIPTGTGNNITKSIPGATATTTIGFWVNWSVIPGVTAAFLKFFSDSGSTEHIDIRIDGTHLQVFRPLSTQLALATSGIVVNTWYYMEVQVTLSDTVGAVVVNVNGTPVISVSGVDTHNPGGTVIDTVQFSGMGSTGTWLVDDIYLRTDATFGAGLAAGVPLSVARALASESDGVSTVASDLTVTHVAAPWAGQSDGTGTAAGTLTVVRSLAGESDGVATTTAAMVVAKALAGESDGVSTVTAALARARPLAGQADGVATVTGALGMTKALAGQSNGVATDSAALTLALSLAGRSDGVGTAPNAPLALLKALSGQSDGLGGASATTLIRVRGLLAQSDGVATVTGAMSLALALAGRSDGASTFTGYFAQAGQVVLGGRSDGVATVSASLSVVRPLAGQSAGVSTVTAALIRARPLAAQSDGVSTTSAGVLVLRGLSAVADGVSTVQGSLNRTVPFVGQSVGVATTVAQLGLDRLLVGRSDGVGDASSDLVVLRFLAGQSDGMSTTVAVLIRDVPLTGQSDGLSTVTALLDIMAMGAIINVWTGSTWRRQTTVTPPILVWNGATWKDDANVWDGEQWQPLNPVG